MDEDASFSQYPAQSEKHLKKSHFVTVFFIVLLLVIVILVGLYFLGASKRGTFNPLPVAPTATPLRPSDSAGQAPTQTPTPTPEPLDRGELTINVLNGSGIAGAAGDTADTLRKLGYTVKTVGNAQEFDYVGITIVITEEKKEYLDLLKKDLADEKITIETEIDDALKVDAEVIVGK